MYRIALHFVQGSSRRTGVEIIKLFKKCVGGLCRAFGRTGLEDSHFRADLDLAYLSNRLHFMPLIAFITNNFMLS